MSREVKKKKRTYLQVQYVYSGWCNVDILIDESSQLSKCVIYIVVLENVVVIEI